MESPHAIWRFNHKCQTIPAGKRLRIEVLEARPSESKPHLGLVRSLWRMTNQASEVVLEMEGWGMFRRRGA